jgi:hypothetical protein
VGGGLVNNDSRKSPRIAEISPGATADLKWDFSIGEGLISRLEIAPSPHVRRLDAGLQTYARRVTEDAASSENVPPGTALPVLRTPRLVIQPLTHADGPACRAVLPALDDDAFRRWFTWAVAAPAALADLRQPPYGERAAFLAETDELVGLVGLVPSLGPFSQLDGDAAGAPWTAELGLYWALSPEHRGCGYATEAAGALCEALFAALTPSGSSRRPNTRTSPLRRSCDAWA